MDVGIIGLGRMGGGVARRLVKSGHRVVAFNRSSEKTEAFAKDGGEAAYSLAELVEKLPLPRVLWVYLPAGEVAETHIAELQNLLSAGDILIDGGNSQFQYSQHHGITAQEKGLHFLDVGTSGGVQGEVNGYCLMIGGPKEAYMHCEPLWKAIATDKGYVHAGPCGSGHFTKMVHNAIEYGMLQAYAEGIELLAAAQLEAPVDIAGVTAVWQQGSIIRSFIGGLVAEAAGDDELIRTASMSVDHTGEGLWAVQEGLRLGLSQPVTTAALQVRLASSINQSKLGNRLISAVRFLFGGHART
jgi:6-phosphogluconate dehydrogenase